MEWIATYKGLMAGKYPNLGQLHSCLFSAPTEEAALHWAISDGLNLEWWEFINIVQFSSNLLIPRTGDTITIELGRMCPTDDTLITEYNGSRSEYGIEGNAWRLCSKIARDFAHLRAEEIAGIPLNDGTPKEIMDRYRWSVRDFPCVIDITHPEFGKLLEYHLSDPDDNGLR